MAPVPIWAKVLSLLVAAAMLPFLLFLLIGSMVALASTDAELHRTTTFAVGSAPKLQLDARFGQVTVEAGSDGQVVVEERQSADAITRAAALDSLRRTGVRTSRQGDLIVVQQDDAPFRSLGFTRGSTVTIHVPVHTDLDIANTTVLVEGTDGVVHFRSDGAELQLRSVVLRGASVIDQPNNQVDMHGVTVVGAATIAAQHASVVFDGSLAPGGSSLDIRTEGYVQVVLPRPTDAHATVTAVPSAFHADPQWGFVGPGPTSPDQFAPVTWTADLGPEPKGAVTIDATAVTFNVR